MIKKMIKKMRKWSNAGKRLRSFVQVVLFLVFLLLFHLSCRTNNPQPDYLSPLLPELPIPCLETPNANGPARYYCNDGRTFIRANRDASVCYDHGGISCVESID